MGPARIIVPLVLFLIAGTLLVCGLVFVPPGSVRTSLLAAGAIDFAIGLATLVFGVRKGR